MSFQNKLATQVIALCFAGLASPLWAADTPDICAAAIGRVVSLQGVVEIRRASGGSWIPIRRLDLPLCSGDMLHTKSGSRAAIVLHPETVVRIDQNSTLQLRPESDGVHVELFNTETLDRDQIGRTCGKGYFITRLPKRFKVYTPFLNAAVEGTEFQVAMACDRATLSVFEGRVAAQGVAASGDTKLLASGEETSAELGEAPKPVKLMLSPAHAVQWALFYPPLGDTDQEWASESCTGLDSLQRSACLSARVEGMLRAGRVEGAQAQIKALLDEFPLSADGYALSSIIALVRNQTGDALSLASRALEASEQSSRAWLAMSYARQAQFDLEESLQAAGRAAELSPGSALIRARVAELFLSLGDAEQAEREAVAATALNPNESRAHTMLGFVHLARLATKEAAASFGVAINLDSTDPLPRLGAGLAAIRNGRLVAGREEIEIAVALNPTHSLLRSYVGKAYYEENTKERDRLAADQYALAKTFDPNDPTPWFYSAQLAQISNSPVTALGELNESLRRNESRAVYRSRLLLDEDIAARTAGAANLHGKLGFEQLGIVTSTKAIEEDPNNHAAHQLLARAYANLPRHDIARVSESLQAQIRRPLSAQPVEPLISIDKLAVPIDTGALRPGLNEYSSLYDRERAFLKLDALAASRGTFGNQFAIGGLSGPVAASFNHFGFRTEGFIDNDSASKDIASMLVQVQASPKSTVQLDLRDSGFEIGETLSRFDPVFNLPVTIEEDSTIGRISGHYTHSSSQDWIWTVAYEDRFRDVRLFPGEDLVTNTKAFARTTEFQHAYAWNRLRLTSGMLYIDEDREFPAEQLDIQSRDFAAYVYGKWGVMNERLRLHLGATLDRYKRVQSTAQQTVRRRQVSPKLGLTWSPVDGTTLRLARFTSVRRAFIGSQTLEPTQVAGFNQYFTGLELLYGDVEGTVSKRSALALDQTITSSLFVGGEVSRRHLTVPELTLSRDYRWSESTARAYLYAMSPRPIDLGVLGRWEATFTVEGEYEKLTRPHALTGVEGIRRLDSRRYPVALRLFGTRGLSFKVGATRITQEGEFSIQEGLETFRQSDRAWIYDASAEFDLPKRRGSISMGVRNWADRFIDIVETDPVNPRVATRRLWFVSFRFVL